MPLKGEVENKRRQRWQDKKIEFPAVKEHSRLCKGEISFKTVGDSNNLSRKTGIIIVTNLRLMFCSNSFFGAPSCSIGFNTIIDTDICKNKRVKGRLTDALRIRTRKERLTTYDFFLIHLSGYVLEFLQDIIQEALDDYKASLPLREVTRSGPSLTSSLSVQPLPKEYICSKFSTIWKIKEDSGEPGDCYSTNYRLIWISHSEDQISIPYSIIKKIDIQYLNLHIHTFDCSVIQFWNESTEKLETVFNEITKLAQIRWKDPIYGFLKDLKSKLKNSEEKETELPEIDDGLDIDLEGKDYLKEPSFLLESFPIESLQIPQMCNSLGLAIEPMPSGKSIEEIWYGPTFECKYY